MTAAPLTRFAPSPTGYLHLGHVVNAIYVWGLAAMLGGRVLLRIEDHDRIRCRHEYDAALLEDLAWLGLTADRVTGGSGVVLRQSDAASQTSYEAALQRLSSVAQVYACDCSRATIRRLGGGDDPERYPGLCRQRGLTPGPGRGLRVVIEPGMETFDDLRLGAQRQEPARQCGDLLLRDRDGHWTYQFAVTVDDIRQGITLVVRGEDLLASTGRQIRLARLLGRTAPPRFFHHPLILGPQGAKLSKSNRDTGVRDLRAAGMTPAEVFGRAAAAAGLLSAPRRLAVADLATLVAPALRDRPRDIGAGARPADDH